jgi:tetratricopeptide (TPR) repeat protein
VRRFFEACEHVRFAPSAGVGDMQGALSLAQQIVRRLERARTLRPGTVVMVAAWSSVVLLGSVALAQSGAPTTPQTTFFHANAAYRDGRYAEAATEYEHIRASGFASGNVYFNLGNAYFKAGDSGRAILNYERAERMLPRDPDVAANLTYARSVTGADACRPPRWQRLVFPLADQLPRRQLGWLLSGCFTAVMLALAAYRLSPRRPRWLLYTATAMSVALAVSAASAARQVYAQDWLRTAVVVADGETSARFEPTPSGTVHFALKQGTRVQLDDTRDGWTQVTRCDGRRGWVESTSVEPL